MDDTDDGNDQFWDAFDDPVALRLLIASGKRFDDHGLLTHAVDTSRPDLVEIFLDANPGMLDAFDPDLSWTALAYAARNGDVDMVRYLIERGANVDAHDAARAGETALYEAVSCGHFEVARLLVEHGADPNIPGFMQHTALGVARRRIRAPEFYELLSNARTIAAAALRARRKAKKHV